jgi:predicted dienelactone hydrolase
MLIYSHGFMSFRQEGLYLAHFLASHGYTVVAADYPMTGFYAPDGPLMEDVINQPADISFLIDSMLERNADPADTLYNTIDPDKIAVAGVSLGALTTSLVTFHRRMRDPRIAAAISIAGPSNIFTADFYADEDVPFLMIYGDSDVIVPYDINAIPAQRAYPGSILVTLKEASHAGFAQPASTIMRFIKNPDEVGCRAMQEEITGDVQSRTDKFMAALGSAEDGIDVNAKLAFCSSTPIPVAMEAARQHMFTTLAAYAFLESVFAEDSGKRAAARKYLLATLPDENQSEVAVTQ